MVFVLLYKGNIEELPRLYFDKSVFYRDADKPARHLKYPYRRPTLIDSENNILTYKDAMLIERAIEEYGEDLFRKHNNLEAISGSSFMLSMSKGYIRLPCLVLYCQVKGIVPYGEKMFPKTLQIGEHTLAVDVREGFLRRGMLQPESLDSQNDKLRMGISIGAMDLNISGTLGPFVKLDGGNIGFITCAHVVEGGNGQIVHPANGESLTDMHLSERLCGEVRNIVFNPQFREQNNGLSINVGVDAALVKVKGKRGVDIEKFPSVTPKALERAGFDPSEPPHFRYGSIQYPLDFQCVQGKRVIKYGQTTGLTKGSIQLKGVMVKRRNAELETPTRFKVVMKNQYIVERHGGVPFFTLGDSGAGVFLVGKNNQLILIGLAIGMLDMDHCVVTPIEYVLQALNLSFKNLQFEEDMDVT
ncbi:hypothetical protein CHS0354_034147 [Potamilus streckersoni]|uniref:Uncharacterized protein n=1 Tax=Potamilus streckersoni TaxID=2493646 RepID=A0AAE0SLU3_9BIVA|nr:hypothetical protein CHS0354_034147 [Potamilus streckersoni]